MDFTAQIKNRTLKFNNLDYLQNYLREMPDEQILMVKIEKRKRLRTNNQNSMYWGLILPTIANDLGYTSEELHSVFKRMFLTRKYITINGKRKLVDPTTTKLSTKEFTEFVEKVLVWSSQELGTVWNIN